MEQSQIDLAKAIVNATTTTGRDDVPEANHPGEPPPADAPKASQERYSVAWNAYLLHLNNLPSSAFADFPSDSPEVRSAKAKKRRDLMAAAVSALELR